MWTSSNAELEADGVPNRETVEDNLAYVRHTTASFDPKRDLSVAELDGMLVGYADRQWVDTTDGLREYRINGSVLPEYRRRGIGTTLLKDNERLQRELAASHETDRPKVLGSWSGDRQEAGSRCCARTATNRCATSSRWSGRCQSRFRRSHFRTGSRFGR